VQTPPWREREELHPAPLFIHEKDRLPEARLSEKEKKRLYCSSSEELETGFPILSGGKEGRRRKVSLNLGIPREERTQSLSEKPSFQ